MDEAQLKAVETALTEMFSKNVGTIEASLQEKMAGVLEQKFAEFVEKHGKDLAAKNTLPVAGAAGADRAQKYAVISEFVKNVTKGNMEALTKGMTENIDSEGGFLVPEEFHAEVMRISEDFGLVSRFAQMFPMSTDTMNIPVEASSVTVYWNDEAAEVTDSEPSLNNAQLIAKNLTGITVASNQLLADAKVSVTEYLMTLFAEAMAGAIDDQAFNGTGSPFLGILNDPNVASVTMGGGQTTFSSVKLGDLRDLISQVKVSCLPTSAFYMHRTVWGAVQKIQENSQTIAAIQNQLLNVSVAGADAAGGGRPAGYLWGYPVYLSDKLPATSATAISTNYIVFGSLKKGLFYGDREQTSMAVSQHASIGGKSMFGSNQSAVRMTQRVAVKIGLPSALVKLKTAAS